LWRIRRATISILWFEVSRARTLAWIAGVVLSTVALPAVARADGIVDDTPGAAARGPGQVEVFLRGSNGAPLVASRTPSGAWTPWRTLDGFLTSGPAAFGQQGANDTDLFVRGGDLALYHRTELGIDWNAWEDLGGVLLSAPRAELRQGTGNVDVAVRGASNEIDLDVWTPNVGWSGFSELPGGGRTLAAPALASRSPGVIDVFVRGYDDQIYEQSWTGSAWTGGWALIGGVTQDAPAVVSRIAGTLDLFIRTPSGQIAWRTFDGANWTDYRTLPGVVRSGPAVATDGTGRMWLFARGGRDVVFNVYSGSGWSGWLPIHPVNPPPTCSTAAGLVSARVATVRYGRHPHVRGRLVGADGRALPGVGVAATRITGHVEGRAVTRPDGRFSIRLPRGRDRRIHVLVPRPALHALACSRPLTVHVRAGVRLHASRTVRPLGRVHFSGRLLGRPFPHPGKLVQLQAFDGGRWRTFANPRATRRGRFHATYRLRRTFGPRTFRFRARVPRERGYPYVTGYSKTVRVRVT
jgi:hypothetical protein